MLLTFYLFIIQRTNPDWISPFCLSLDQPCVTDMDCQNCYPVIRMLKSIQPSTAENSVCKEQTDVDPAMVHNHGIEAN